MNKFLSLFLLLSIGCLSAMNPNTEPRLRQREQFEYFRMVDDEHIRTTLLLSGRW